MNRLVLAGGALVMVAAAAAMPWSGLNGIGSATERHLGSVLYADHCAACHGADLEGAPNWWVRGPDGRLPAPPHDETGHTWHDGDGLLFDYTKYGGRIAMARRGVEVDSGMPGFAGALSDDEIWRVLDFIKSTWPDEIRQIQRSRTDAEG